MKKISAFFLLAVLAILACYEGNGLDPIAGIEDAAGIRGRVTYTGLWPDSTKEVRIVVMKSYPVGITDNDSLIAFMLNAINTGQLFFSDTLTRFAESSEYEIQVRHGEYAWVLAAWFPDTKFYLTEVKQLGAYTIEAGKSHSPVRVMPGSWSENIDINADLNRARGDQIFFKPGGQR